MRCYTYYVIYYLIHINLCTCSIVERNIIKLNFYTYNNKIMIGYIYIRRSPQWDEFKCYKVGKTTNIVNRETTYITGEIERGSVIKAFKFINITDDYLNIIDNTLKYELEDYNFYKNAGTEFYKTECIHKIANIFKDYSIDFIELSEYDINEITRTAYKSITLKKNNIIKLSKNKIYNSEEIIPYSYQQETLDIMKKYYEFNKIGRISWSCGLGKALLGIFFVKQSNYKNVVIGIPSIHLQKQMKNEILKIFNNNVSILNIGGDKNNNINIEKFINIKTNNHKFIITTYSSCYLLSNNNYYFDLKIGDESHHLVGTQNEITKYSFHKIKSNNTLFMTATEKVINDKYNSNIYSMDNEKIFGTLIDSKSINWAIENKKITDYNIIILKNTENEINHIINSLNLKSKIISMKKNKDMFLSAFMALKSIERYHSLTHILIYTNITKNSILIKEYIDILLNLNIFNIDKDNYYNEALHSKSNKNLLDKKLHNDNILEGEITKFNKSKWGIISSVYIFGEGFDCPRLNGVIFSENMESEIRIVQAALRPNRLDKNNLNKVAYVMIPYIENDLIITNNSFNKCKDIIAKIRNVDENIQYKIKMISLSANINNGNNSNICYESPHIIENDIELKKIKLRLIYSKSLGSTCSEEQNEFNYMKHLNSLLNIQDKEEYVKEYVKEFYLKNGIEYIQEIEKHFTKNCVWTNWYDFMGIDTSIFLTNKEEWKKFCKLKNVNSLKKYIEMCDLYKELPRNPAEFYIGFTDLSSELELSKNRRR